VGPSKQITRCAEIALWAALLPWVGYWLLSIRLVGIPIFILWADPLGTAKNLYAAGFVPSLVPAAAFVILRRAFNSYAAIPIAMILSVVACWIWWRIILSDDNAFLFARGGTIMVLAIAGLAPAIFALASVPRNWLAPPEPPARKSALARLEDRVFRRLFPGD
jgi:hypothetical protein